MRRLPQFSRDKNLSAVLPEGAASDTSTPALALTKSQQVQGMFNRIARTYDLLNDCISFGMHRAWKRRACQALRLQPGAAALDVCTGTGDLIGYLLPLAGPSGSVTGLDFSEDMLAIARQRFQTPSAHQAAIHLDQGDALHLPYPDAHFDGAIISFGLRNVVDIPRAIGEMARVVKPGGWIVSLDTCPDPKLPGYWFYFKTVMPLVGRLLSMDPTAYQYLSSSTEHFLSPAEIRQVFETAGLTAVTADTLMMQSVSLVAGQKPQAS